MKMTKYIKNVSVDNKLLSRQNFFLITFSFFLVSSSSLQGYIGGKTDPYYDVIDKTDHPGGVHTLKTELGEVDIGGRLKESHPTFIGSMNVKYNIPLEELNKIRHPAILDFPAKEKAKGAAKGINTYDIDICAATFSVSTKDKPTAQDIDDYYDILLEFKPTPSKELSDNFFLPTGYRLEAYPVKFVTNNNSNGGLSATPQDNCKLDAWDWCPLNTMDRKSTYTDSMQFTLGGNIGGGFPTAVTGSISPSFSIGHQYARDIMDIDTISTMHLNKAQWDINYNRLSLDQKNGFSPGGTLKQSLRWVWKVNHQDALGNLYQNSLPGEDPNQFYLPLQVNLFAGFAHMHQTGKEQEHKRTPLLPVVTDYVLLKIPSEPKPDKGKGIIFKSEHFIKSL